MTMTPGDETIDVLMGRCRSGDEAAWRQLVEHFSNLVYSVMRRNGLPEDACLDVFQIVFARLLQSVDSIRDAAALPKWLITTTQRECWRAARRLKREGGPLPETVAASGSEPFALDWERQVAVRRGLERLDERCCALLTAVFLDRSVASYDELAIQLGMPRGSIGPTRRRCLDRLLDLLIHEPGNEHLWDEDR